MARTPTVTAGATSTCVECGAPVVDITIPTCPNCSKPWAGGAPVVGAPVVGGPVVGAPVATTKTSRVTIILLVVLALLVGYIAIDKNFVGFDFSTWQLRIGPNAGAQIEEATLWDVEQTLPSGVEYRYSVTPGTQAGEFQCRVSGGDWMSYDLEMLVQKWNETVSLGQTPILPDSCGNVPIEIQQ